MRKNILNKIDLHKFVSRTAQNGSVPGTVEYIGKPRLEDVRINVLEYDASKTAEMHPLSSV